MNIYSILDTAGNIRNRIIADPDYVEAVYPDRYILEGPVAENVHARLSVLQLRRLFTLAEKVALEDAIKNGNSAVKVFMDDLAAADFVDLSDPLVIEGLQFLVQHEFLTQARADQILRNEEPNA